MIRRLLKNVLGENFTENNAKLATVNLGVILLMFVLSGIMLFFPSGTDFYSAYGRNLLSDTQCSGSVAVSDYCIDREPAVYPSEPPD